MTPGETRSLLQAAPTAIFTTLGSDGYPHPTAMWFLPEDSSIRMWTYAKSQKAVNLRRDPRCAFLVEEGETYEKLRGVLVRADARIIEDEREIEAIGRGLYERYTFPVTGIAYEEGPHIEVERQTSKRIGVEIPIERIATWDHGKL